MQSTAQVMHILATRYHAGYNPMSHHTHDERVCSGCIVLATPAEEAARLDLLLRLHDISDAHVSVA